MHTVSQKDSTFKPSVTLWNLNRFSKFLHCWKAVQNFKKPVKISQCYRQFKCGIFLRHRVERATTIEHGNLLVSGSSATGGRFRLTKRLIKRRAVKLQICSEILCSCRATGRLSTDHVFRRSRTFSNCIYTCNEWLYKLLYLLFFLQYKNIYILRES